MKQLFVILATATILASCNNSASNTEALKTDSTAVAVDSCHVDSAKTIADTTKAVK
jgi:hypothetical protein